MSSYKGMMYSGRITGVRFNISEIIARSEKVSSWEMFTGRKEQFEQIEQSEQDVLEKQKWFERLMRSVESDPPYGALNAIEREDVDLIVRNTNVSAQAAAKAYLRSSGDIVDAIMSVTD